MIMSYSDARNQFPPLLDYNVFDSLYAFTSGIIRHYDKYIFSNNICQVRISSRQYPSDTQNYLEIVVNNENWLSIYTKDFRKYGIYVNYDRKELHLNEGKEGFYNEPVFQFTFDNFMGFRPNI